MPSNYVLLFLPLLWLAFASHAPGAPRPSLIEHDASRRAFFLQIENDNLMGTDRDYSSGVRASIYSDNLPFVDMEKSHQITHRINDLPFFGEGSCDTAYDFSIGHSIYTPPRKSATEVVPDERPYAGLAYLSFGFMQFSCDVLSTWEFMLGLVGPGTHAEEIQNTVHDWKGRKRAMGWKNQLENEPIFNVFHDHRWKYNWGGNEGAGIELIPQLSAALGNGFTSAAFFTELRMGWNIPEDFGDDYIRPATRVSTPGCMKRIDRPFAWKEVGLFGFASAGVTGVHRNILLDGNTFADSHSVDKEPWVNETAVGIGVMLNRLKLTYAMVDMSRTYETQRRTQQFGSISMTWTW